MSSFVEVPNRMPIPMGISMVQWIEENVKDQEKRIALIADMIMHHPIVWIENGKHYTTERRRVYK